SLLTRDPAHRPASLTEVREKLEQAATSRQATPVLGMSEEREALRRAVIGAADGEPRVVVMYGPPGSGRRTLLAETVEAAPRGSALSSRRRPSKCAEHPAPGSLGGPGGARLGRRRQARPDRAERGPALPAAPPRRPPHPRALPAGRHPAHP